jgi:hypothetical protein
MALTLDVNTAAWRAMVDGVWGAFPGLIPVIKGNGYGLGREFLAGEARRRGATQVAVGTVFEIGDLAVDGPRPIVLTPSLDLDSVAVDERVILTVGSFVQLEHLLRHRPNGTVVLKVVSSARRHGVAPEDAQRALRLLGDAGVSVHSVSVHPRLAGSDDERSADIEQIVTVLPPGIAVTVSHLGAHHYVGLAERHADRQFGIRLGSALWHGDKSCFALRAKALDVRTVRRGEVAGYRGIEVPGDGSLVIVDAGSAHGVQPLANGDSPFHFGRRRLHLLEAPHMHVSMVFVPTGEPTPAPGDEIDVQRPLITTSVDQIRWR